MNITRLIFSLILGYLILSIVAWVNYPEYIFNFKIAFLIWKYGSLSEIPISFIVTTQICVLGAFLFALKNTNLKRFGSKYGYAGFNNNIKKAELNFKKGIILGRKGSKFIKSNTALSLLVLAPPGTGKTAGIIIPTLLTLRSSVIVHDPKGEIYDLTKNARSKIGKVFLFDPLSDETAHFNVFANEMLPKDERDMRAYIGNIGSILFKAPREGDKFFIDAAKSAFLFFAEWLIWKNGETSIPEIRDKLLEDADVSRTVRAMIVEEGLPFEIKQDGNGVLVSEDSEKQWAGVVGTFKESVEIFADSRVKNATTGKCDFTGESLRKEISSVFIKVRDQDSKRLEPLMTMLFERLGTQLISTMPEKSDNRVTFILDEFVRLGRMDVIRDLPAISRGYNVNTIFVAQDYEQISQKYGREAISTFDSNCAYKVIFQQNNFVTAEKISKLIGNRTDKRISSSKSSNNRGLQVQSQIGQSHSSSQEGIALVTPQDILNMKKDECLILAQGYAAHPIKAKIAFYFKSRKFKKLINLKR